jgi:hypothetical protein
VGYAVSKFGDTWRYVAMGRAARRDAAKSARHTRTRAIRGARSVASRDHDPTDPDIHLLRRGKRRNLPTCFRFRRFVRLSQLLLHTRCAGKSMPEEAWAACMGSHSRR